MQPFNKEMKVFKFGGASVKDAEGVKNVTQILKKYGAEKPVIVISAMGKTTNAIEEILNAWWYENEYRDMIGSLKEQHLKTVKDLGLKSHPVKEEIKNYFLSLELFFEKKLERNYDYIYDQVVGYGELASTRIVSAYLNENGYKNKWLDVRNFIITNDLFREARVDWEVTSMLINRIVPTLLEDSAIVVQGFLGSTKDNVTTTLGREGSDFTASVFAHALNAEEVVIWKDVPGVMNKDPRKFPDAIKFETLSYHDAVEMTYYGATVLHPKTIKPIQNKNIPLQVRSFIEPAAEGTLIKQIEDGHDNIPVVISKENQVLLSLSTHDYSFMAEDNIARIFAEVVKYGIKINVMNNSAISFYLCADNMSQKIEKFIAALAPDFDISIVKNLELFSIKNYRNADVQAILNNREVVLEQRSGQTLQCLVKV